ncbi:DUF438 domain-containing protein [Herbinix luporum]|jgi:DUF438 domain-containing protein|uniref:DUF438 domain-containing protein n=1 Tax=Herbinix luporum TaxID=1679721 RepID=A0A0K8J574_9FIRM|nr:DUF438 domain-containing protein [Herbinix luporum]MDI9488723.1 DUF438 domain-containing protein [Bacillota bacterium]CUH92811.1 hypothetical protein SD1D_1265 [Herbinix luporum]HHT57310.1 DUF438 domain-containing protein [Herbinix luporum]
MSELINNREKRKEVLKEIIKKLHEGSSVEEVKDLFESTFNGVSPMEISEAEKALILEGVPISEVQRLCDVHASVFKGSIEEIHRPKDETEIPGHPAYILKKENRVIEDIIDREIMPYIDIKKSGNKDLLIKGLQSLSKIELHYLRKENIIFPFMEKYNITAPPKVMWGVDDEIRAELKEVKQILSENIVDEEKLNKKLNNLISKVKEMIFKEENILLPMILETFTQDEWIKIALDSKEIGYMIDQVPVWNPTKEYKKELKKEVKEGIKEGIVTLPSGVFKVDELVSVLNTLPFDITFVDKDDKVKYFSEGSERIFPRTRSIIGRDVSNCHPPQSVHVVEKIVEDLKSGAKDHEDFWIKMKDKYVLIRYFAVRNVNNEYLGVLEVSQDIKPIQEIQGEKRLVSE